LKFYASLGFRGRFAPATSDVGGRANEREGGKREAVEWRDLGFRRRFTLAADNVGGRANEREGGEREAVEWWDLGFRRRFTLRRVGEDPGLELFALSC